MSKRPLVVLLAMTACGLSSEDSFIGTARKDPCDQSVPVCSTTAGCRLVEDENYTEFKVPGYRSFVVNTDGEADIVLHFFWKRQLSPGTEQDFTFYEPGCQEPRVFSIDGEQMFRQIGQDSRWRVKQTVYQAGDHLIELRMEAQGTFLLKAEVVTPQERNEPQDSSDAPEPDFPGF
jgi:hypothetical protein